MINILKQENIKLSKENKDLTNKMKLKPKKVKKKTGPMVVNCEIKGKDILTNSFHEAQLPQKL